MLPFYAWRHRAREEIGAMSYHCYWVVKCKGNCGTPLRVQYIGISDGRAYYEKPSAGPAWLDLVCAVCHTAHRYNMPLDLEWYQTPEKPEREWVDILPKAPTQ
jgi:hypothetical protein